MTESNPYTIEETMTSKGHIDNYVICWTIPKCLQLLKTIISLDFRTQKNTIVEMPKSKFQLKMCFEKKEKEFDIILYYLSPTSIFVKLEINAKLAGTGINDNKYLQINDNKYLQDYCTVQANKWKCCRAFDFMNRISNTQVSLILTFNFLVDRSVKVEFDKPMLQLCDDFKNLLIDGTGSDVTLKSAEGVEFRVHKLIISTRSKVLKSHFEHNTKESVTNIVETTWNTAVLRDLLMFVYTDHACVSNNDPQELLVAADFYQLEGLKSLCEEELRKRLNVENAIDTLQLAELYSANSLKEATLDFIKQGRARMIVDTPGWANIKSVELVKKIYEYIMSNEIDYFDILAYAFKELSKRD